MVEIDMDDSPIWVGLIFLIPRASANNLQSQPTGSRKLKISMCSAKKYCLTITHLLENLAVVRPWSWLFSTKLKQIPLCSEHSLLFLSKGCPQMSKLQFAIHHQPSLW